MVTGLYDGGRDAYLELPPHLSMSFRRRKYQAGKLTVAIRKQRQQLLSAVNWRKRGPRHSPTPPHHRQCALRGTNSEQR